MLIILYYTLNVNISYFEFFCCKDEKSVEALEQIRKNGQ